MIASDVLTTVRRTIHDEQTPYRYSDTELLAHLSDAFSEITIFRPDLLQTDILFSCAAGATIQKVIGMKLIDVVRVRNGNAVREVDRDFMNFTYPNWTTEPTGPAQAWMRVKGSDSQFMLYPRAPQDQELRIVVSAKHGPYAASDELPLRDEFLPVLHDYIVFRTQTKDAEYVDEQKVALFMKTFAERLSANVT